MGTRNLTVVIKNDKIVLSQYGQWDGYFSYTGVKFLEFVKDKLQYGKSQKRIDINCQKFSEQLECIGEANQDVLNKIQNTTDSFSCNSSKNTTKYAIPFNMLFPSLCRDTGVEILNIISNIRPYAMRNKSENTFKKLPIHIETDIKACGFGIEYVYIIDIDKQEIYMFTCHDFKKEALIEITDNKTVDNVYNIITMACFYKSKIKDIPSIKKVQSYVESIGLN